MQRLRTPRMTGSRRATRAIARPRLGRLSRDVSVRTGEPPSSPGQGFSLLRVAEPVTTAFLRKNGEGSQLTWVKGSLTTTVTAVPPDAALQVDGRMNAPLVPGSVSTAVSVPGVMPKEVSV